MFYFQRHRGMFINITLILHENREHVPAVSTKYSHLAATPGAAYPPRLGLAYLGQYLGHILSKVYATQCQTPCWSLRFLHSLDADGRGASVDCVLSAGVGFRKSFPCKTRDWHQTGSGVCPSCHVHGSIWCAPPPCRLWMWGTQDGNWWGHYVFVSWKWASPMRPSWSWGVCRHLCPNGSSKTLAYPSGTNPAPTPTHVLLPWAPTPTSPIPPSAQHPTHFEELASVSFVVRAPRWVHTWLSWYHTPHGQDRSSSEWDLCNSSATTSLDLKMELR